MTDEQSFFGPPISVYTRAQALADGELVDVTTWASDREGFFGGFRVPVAMTRALWAAVAAIPPRLRGIADVRGRAHDVLWMASLALRRASRAQARGTEFLVVLPRAGERRMRIQLRVEVGPGDAGETVVTIGLPGDF